MVISCNSNVPALEEMQALLYHSENALLIGCLNKKLITVDLAFGNITGEVLVTWMCDVLVFSMLLTCANNGYCYCIVAACTLSMCM